jgi:hypothetical protein
MATALRGDRPQDRQAGHRCDAGGQQVEPDVEHVGDVSGVVAEAAHGLAR